VRRRRRRRRRQTSAVRTSRTFLNDWLLFSSILQSSSRVGSKMGIPVEEEEEEEEATGLGELAEEGTGGARNSWARARANP